ncbi:MAG: 5'/3'-nucleotidase SurE [Chitinophagaceae bacterium]|nr:5'/3'-nucleotidase SurE [Chitinophagaceae bacterium]
MRILITNDDGIYSPGIAALATIASRFGQATAVAPDVEQSSMGHAVTHSRPLSIKRARLDFNGVETFKVNGTPADCVALGMHLYAKTDLALSGINMGPNLGNSMWHSGTLAGAKQAVLFGVKGIAFSVSVGKMDPDFTALEPYVEKVLRVLIEMPGLALYNVNLPARPIGVRWTRQSVRLYDGAIIPGVDPMGRKHYWFTVKPLEPADEGTDRWAVENGYVSITPLLLDLTHHDQLIRMQEQKPL